MAEVPSLVNLCIHATKRELLRGDEDVSCVYELPPELFDSLVECLPPFALEKLQTGLQLPDSNGFDSPTTSNDSQERKRRRKKDFSVAWKALFMLRWPGNYKNLELDSFEARQVYWQTHLQDCLDKALELAMLPSFSGCLGEIEVSDTILKHIVQEESLVSSTWDVSRLFFHFQQFGCYARHLRLHNVLNIQESSKLLRNCKLQSVEVQCLRSEGHVKRLCKLLSQNHDTLKSVELLHCMVCPKSVDAICGSLLIKSLGKHQIECFSISSSTFLETSVSSARALASFLTLGRSLTSLRLHDNNLDGNFAKILFNALLNASSDLSILDLSENHITGWLSDFNWRSSGFSGITNSLPSLLNLNLRANNLQKDDTGNIRHALIHMPRLEMLDLSENPFGDEGMSRLIPFFVEAPGRGILLTRLVLEDCEISNFGAEQLLNSISTYERPVKWVSLAHNYLNSDVAPALGKFLSTTHIQVLNIEDIGLGPSGFQKLYEALIDNLALVEINISKNRGGTEVARFLSKLFPCAPALVRVDAAQNLMPTDSLTLIHSALKDGKGHLEHLDLTGNLMDPTSHSSLFDEFKHNGRPVVILPSSKASNIPYDDDP